MNITCVAPLLKPDFPPVSPQLLVQREADLFAENENRETPCDCAEKQHHEELALCLESQMVFSLAPEAEGIEAEYAALDRKEVRTRCPALSGWTVNHSTCGMSVTKRPVRFRLNANISTANTLLLSLFIEMTVIRGVTPCPFPY